eukprot:11388173-Heterocapsa_arctica.AAC.1
MAWAPAARRALCLLGLLFPAALAAAASVVARFRFMAPHPGLLAPASSALCLLGAPCSGDVHSLRARWLWALAVP